jgi:esterase/lipase
MVHGLTDSPFALRDLGEFFQRQGFYVLGMQLPGHGTRPGDLLHIRWHDWARAHRHLLDLLCKRFDAVYFCGFSAGATLSLYRSLLDTRIRGLFLFAPALGVSPVARLSLPLSLLGRYWRRPAWFDVQPDSDCFKYESLAQRGIAEVCRMIDAVRELVRHGDNRIPVFVAASEQDAVLDSGAILEWFERLSGPRRMLYYTSGQPQVPPLVKRIPSRFPEQGIRSFAHTSLIHSPANPHYGARGTQRVCAHYYRLDPPKYARCKAGEEDCLGEIFGESDDCRTIRRLTYNPLFEEMLDEMRDFIANSLDA